MQNRIHYIRKAANMTQAEFGEALGVSRGIIAKLETGVTPPSKTLLLLMSNIFGVNLHWLETGEGSPYGLQTVPALVEALKPYPDVLAKFSILLPRMTVDDLQHLTDEISKIINDK